MSFVKIKSCGVCNERLWRLLEDWADSYARVNGIDKRELIERIAKRHPHLSSAYQRIHEQARQRKGGSACV